jgi:uncharacterized delta-60 repeat protein
MFSLINLQSPVWAADGDLDTTFDTDGIVTTTIGSSTEMIRSVVIQSDGKIVAAGYSNNGTNNDFAVVRYNSDGSLDTTFGTGGKVITSIGGGNDAAYSVALQSDGKIVLGGYSRNGLTDDFAIVRYNNNGSIDTTFDADGIVIYASSAADFLNSILIQSDGKIVAAGYMSNGADNDFAVLRYNTDGSLDTTFDTDGKVITTIGSDNDNLNAAVLQSDGKIVAAGYSNNGTNNDFAVVRYNTDGSLDTTFDTDGKVTTADAAIEVARSILIQSDGKIVAAGNFQNGSTYDFALVRYNTNGSLDTTFGTGGKVTSSLSSTTEWINSIKSQSDGTIVAAGYANNGTNDDFAVARYNTDGSLDTTFGTSGKVLTQILTNEVVYSVAIQSDGKILAAGSARGAKTDFAIVRYNSTIATSDSTQDDGAWRQKITPIPTITPDAVFNIKNRKYQSKNVLKTKLRKNRSFKRNIKDDFQYSIFNSSKKMCLMQGNYVMALKKKGTCNLNISRTTKNGEKYKYWVQINYNK